MCVNIYIFALKFIILLFADYIKSEFVRTQHWVDLGIIDMLHKSKNNPNALVFNPFYVTLRTQVLYILSFIIY